MTRFARAQGSKSSNVKQPEEPTSWAEMKKGMQVQLAKQEDYSSAKSALDSVKNRRNDHDVQTTWGNLGDTDASEALSFMKAQLKKRRENKVNDENQGSVNDNCKKVKKKTKGQSEEKKVDEHVEKKEKEKKIKNEDNEKKLNKRKQIDFADEEKKTKKARVEVVEEVKNTDGPVKNKRKKNDEGAEETPKKKCKKSKKGKDNKNEVKNDENTGKKAKNSKNEIKNDENTAKKGKKRKLNDSGEKKNFVGNNGDFQKGKNFKSPKKPNKHDRKRKFEELKQKRREKREKLKDLSPQERRRKPLPETQEAHINGQAVQLQMFDGFWVTKEDAERLKKLKDDMFEKNLPLKDINNAIKLERRRAEKSLARLKKKVCFQCRKSGHALSECPELTDTKPNNICYKCGSTEHTAYLCKVSQGNQFRFAECFVCKEQGHIAKQCPDNPRGLYPKGGACNVCGDVTHLKKDCPRLISQKEEASLAVGVRDNRMIEDLDEQLFEKKTDVAQSSAKRKHVRF